MLDHALADHGLRNATDGHIICMRRDFHFQFQADVAIRMHARRKVYIHANVQIRELRIHQRIYKAGATGRADAYTRLKTACRNGDAIANAQFGGLAVHRANFRILDNLRVCISKDGVCGGAWQGEDKISSIQVAQLV